MKANICQQRKCCIMSVCPCAYCP